MSRTVKGSLALCIAALLLQPVGAQTYRIEELPPVLGPNSYGLGINEASQVVGQGSTTVVGAYRATRWQEGAPESLGTLPGYGLGIAWDIGEDGTVIGSGLNSACDKRPIAWVGGILTPLPYPLDRTACDTWRINDAGAIIGQAWNCGASTDDAACRWDRSGDIWSLTILPPLPGHPQAHAWDINSDGVVVGWSGEETPAGPFRACRWQGEAPIVIEELGAANSAATAINDLGNVAGMYQPLSGLPWQAFFHDGAGLTPIATLPGFQHGSAWAMNRTGTVVGIAYNGDNWIYRAFDLNATFRGFVWRDGIAHDVNQLIPAGTGWVVTALLDINDSGSITGYGRRGGHWRALRLTPCLGDLDDSGDVALADLALLLAHFGTPGGATYAEGDVDADGDVDLQDLARLLSVFGTTCP